MDGSDLGAFRALAFAAGALVAWLCFEAGCRRGRRSARSPEPAARADALDEAPRPPPARLRLSSLGVQVSQAIRVPAIVHALAEVVGKRCVGLHPYDVQELAKRHVHDAYEPDATTRERILQAAYDHGLSRAQVLDVLAIELRDVLLKRAERAEREEEAILEFDAWRRTLGPP